MILATPALLALCLPPLEPLRKATAAFRRVKLGPPPTPNRRAEPYQGTIDYQGIPIAVENAVGSTRRGVDPQGKPWATKLTAHYGEFTDTVGVDGDPVDVFVGPDADAPMAYVVHRKWPGTEVYDEDKVVLGVRTGLEAEALFRANYNAPGNIGGVTPWPVEELRAYLAANGKRGERLDQPRRVRLLLRKAIPRGTKLANRPGLVLAPTQSGARRWRRLVSQAHVKGAEIANHLDELGPEFLDDPETVRIATRAGWKFHVRPTRYHPGQYVFDIGKQPRDDNAHTVTVDPVAKAVTVRPGWEISPHAGAILSKLRERKDLRAYQLQEEIPLTWDDGFHGREPQHTALGSLEDGAARVRRVSMITPEKRDGQRGYKLQRHHVTVAKTPDEVPWYHATRASSVPSIMERGLVPGAKKQGEGWTEYNLHLQRANYLTHDPEYARRIAETLADRFGEKAVVLRVDGKALSDPRKIAIDEDVLRNDFGIASHEGSGGRMPAFYQSMHDRIASVAYRDRIAPEHLQVHHEVEPTAEEDEEELHKAAPIKGRAGLHLDAAKHRWVRDGDIRPGATFPSPLGDLTVHHADEREAVVRPAGGGASVSMPRASASHFFNDLAGSLAGHTPTSGNPHVDGVIRHNGAWLGKGNDGIVFGHGDKVVKVSTTVPYQPFNAGHRTPDEAAEHLQHEADAHEHLQGIPHVPSVSAYRHEGRTWLVKPHLAELGKLSAGEADSVRDSVRAMHARGWVLGDTVQLGRDHTGAVQFMDLGQAHPSTGDHERERDEERLEELYREHGHDYYPVGEQLRRTEGARRMMVNAALKRGDLSRAEHYHAEWKEHARRRGAELAGGDFDTWMQHEDRVDDINRRMQALRAGAEPMAKGAGLRLLKATIRTPIGGDGKVDYDAVPVGASIWVRVTDPHSPLHGRPILLTKRPDHQFALTGGSGAAHIKARRHLTVSTGRAKASKADEAELEKRQEAEARNAPVRARQRALRTEARKAQAKAEEEFMAALGVKRRGLTKDERAKVHEAARAHGEASGLTGRDADAFGKLVADGIARKERVFRVQQAAHRLDLARHIAAGHDTDEATALAGEEPAAPTYQAPEVSAETWITMTPEEREHHVAADLDRQDVERIVADAEDARFENEPGTEGDGAVETPADPLEDVAPTPGPPEDHPDLDPLEQPAAEEQPAGESANETPTPAAPAFVIGHDGVDVTPAEPEEKEEAAPPPSDTSGAPEPPESGERPPSPASPILNPEAARAALEKFREYAGARKAVRELGAGIEKLPELEAALPSSVDDLRLRLGAVDDAELDTFLQDYVGKATGPADAGFYDALSPHWNDTIGNKLGGAVTKGAASALTAAVGDSIAARFDVHRLVDSLGPEAAAMAVVHRMREEIDGPAYKAFVDKLRTANATGIEAAEGKALRRHAELQRQHHDLERQIAGGDITSQANVDVLRARNLLEQRENLGTALGSMQASAALYHFAEQAIGARSRKQDVVINVGSKPALADKLKRLGKVRATTSYHPTLGYQIHTDTEALRKFVGRTETNVADAEKWRGVKYDTTGITPDDEGREWVPDYRVPGFRPHFPAAEDLPPDQQHLAGKPIQFLADQRNNIDWLHGSGGGLVTMRTGGGKTVVSLGVAGKMLAENPRGRHLRIVPDGREEQWAAEARNFTTIPVVVLPSTATKAERHAILRSAQPGSVVVVGHSNAGRYDHEALASSHEWDSIGIDEPQELRAKSGSGRLGAGAKRIMRIPAKNRHALTATPATDAPVEAFDIVNWTRPGVLGYRTRFSRAFGGFGGGTNAQDAALERSLYREIEPHVSGERLVSPHYGIAHHDRVVSMSQAQLARQREIEAGVDAAVQAAQETAKARKQAGDRGYVEKSYAALYREAREKVIARFEGDHRVNLAGGDPTTNPKLAELRRVIGSSAPSERHVVFVEGPEQRRAVTAMLEGMGKKGEIHNITANAKGATVKRDGVDVPAIEERKRKWKAGGGVILIDRTSASGHNLAEGDHLHVVGNPDDAAQLLQVHGRLGRSNRQGDFAIHTYRYDDSPFEHDRWNRLERQLKVLRATAPGLFVAGKEKGQQQAAMAKGRRILLRLARR